jgi:hypothetical protein
MQSLSDYAASQLHMESRITWDSKHVFKLQGHHNNTSPTLSEGTTFPLKSMLSSHVIAKTSLTSRDIFPLHEPIVQSWYSRMFRRGCTEHVKINL